MLRWTILRRHASPLRSTCLWSAAGFPPRNAPGVAVRCITHGTTFKRQDEKAVQRGNAKRTEPSNLESIKGSERTDAWLALLESTLPPALRTTDRRDERQDRLEPAEIFEILRAANTTAHASHRRDVLTYIAYEQGRWDVVVWLVKHLVESLGVRSSDTESTEGLICTWKNDTSLESLTLEAVDPMRSDFLQQPLMGHNDHVSLAKSTDHRAPDTVSQRVLGMIWRGLGNMTIACTDDEIKPEILEIIALLHHQGFMPSTIYDSKPSPDATAIQQSPILDLLSSRILTSLSDAAWRAHQKLTIQEAKSQRAVHASLGPELPSSSYRVRVAGLKPEVWLELILWSCLHGGWITEGAYLLEKLYNTRDPHQWKPLSWRSLVSEHSTATHGWEKVEYLFNNWTSSSMDPEEPLTPVSVHRTISSELVDAYVDASVCISRLPGSTQGVALAQTIEFVGKMQQFLARSSLSLGAGSWDAIILRLFDLQDSRVYNPKIFDNLIRLSPKMGQEIVASNTQSLPEYVFDGTAATFGLFHRALYHRIKQADVEGALRLFASLQERADENKRQSVADFLQKRQIFSGEPEEKGGQFSDNFASIEYPAFYVQIPPTLLGPFLELVTDAKAYNFGQWLLHSEEVDGPIIPQDMYGDPSITPALIRFAAESGDKNLLSRVIKARATTATEGEPALPKIVLRSFLHSQINLMRWQAAVKILEHGRDTYGRSWNALTLCHLVRVILRQATGNPNAKESLARAQGLFRAMIQGRYETSSGRPDSLQEEIDNLLVILAYLGESWTGLTTQNQMVTGYRVFNLSSKTFNLVLDGVVDAYGSLSARKLIGVFWNHDVRRAQLSDSESDIRSTIPPFSSFAQTMPSKIRRQRTEIYFPHLGDSKVVIYGGLRPDLMTIRIVLKKAVEEFLREPAVRAQTAEAEAKPVNAPAGSDTAFPDDLEEGYDQAIDLSPAGMVVWCARCLKRLGMTVEDLAEELQQSLPESRLQEILDKAPDLLEPEEEQSGGNERARGHAGVEGGQTEEGRFTPMQVFDSCPTKRISRCYFIATVSVR